jgi:ubiquinone/menaquinone biosynthesis C-methylase UbiE
VTSTRHDDVVVGNYHHKYTSTNPAIRWLTQRFMGRLDAVFAQVAAEQPAAQVVEVGCGEGEVTKRLAGRWDQVLALDLPAPELRADWAGLPGPTWLHANAERLPFADDAFDVGVAVEVLEHLTDPETGLAELARVCRGHLVVSVPREPIFRMGNLAALRHVRALGNTPGHFQHWSSRSFVRFCERVGRVRVVDKPLPWTICWIEL